MRCTRHHSQARETWLRFARGGTWAGVELEVEAVVEEEEEGPLILVSLLLLSSKRLGELEIATKVENMTVVAPEVRS